MYDLLTKRMCITINIHVCKPLYNSVNIKPIAVYQYNNNLFFLPYVVSIDFW